MLNIKKYNNRILPQLTLVASSLIAMTSPTFAQKSNIDEIIVSGEKIDRSIQDTTSSVAVFSGSQIEDSAIFDLQELFNRIANVNSANGNEGFTIRGINNNEVSATGTSPLSSLYIDGAFIGRRGIQFGQKDLWDVSQVEVFRGPQSTNQGRNSLAGSVVLRTNDPTFEAEGQYRVAYGTDNTQIFSVAYGDVLIEDELAFRLSFDRQSTDGFINNQFLDDDEAGDSSNKTFRGKLLYEPKAVPGLSVLTTLSYSENKLGDNFSSILDVDGNETDPFNNEIFSNIAGLDDLDQTIASTEINYEINENWSFTSITSYSKEEYERIDDEDRQSFGGIANNDREEETETFSQEFRFNFDYEKTRGNVGVYFFDQDLEEQFDEFSEIGDSITSAVSAGLLDEAVFDGLNTFLSTPALAALQPFGFPASASENQASIVASSVSDLVSVPFLLANDSTRNQSISNAAVYANIEHDFNSFVTVFGGFRYDVEEVDNQLESIIDTQQLGTDSEIGTLSNTIISTLGLTPFLPFSSGIEAGINSALSPAILGGVNQAVGDATSLPSIDEENSFTAFLPKVGITLNWADNLSTSLTVQRAYRAGGAGATTGVGAFDFEPEFTTNYDFAFRSQWLDNRLTLNASLFYVDWEDQQVTFNDPLAVSDQENVTANIGESSLYGTEIDLSYQFNSKLNIYSSFGYVQTEFDSVDSDLTLLSGDDLTGNEFNNAPEVTASTGVIYDVLPSLTVQADITYEDESFNDPENESENDSRTLVNSRITYRHSNAIQVSLVARNIFDQEYLTRNDQFNRGDVIVGQPRSVLLQLQGGF